MSSIGPKDYSAVQQFQQTKIGDTSVKDASKMLSKSKAGRIWTNLKSRMQGGPKITKSDAQKVISSALSQSKIAVSSDQVTSKYDQLQGAFKDCKKDDLKGLIGDPKTIDQAKEMYQTAKALSKLGKDHEELANSAKGFVNAYETARKDVQLDQL